MTKLSPERRYLRAINWVKNGQINVYMLKDPVHYTKYYSQIKARWGIQLDFTYDRRQFEHYWIYGKPGTGKSAVLDALWPHAYVLSNKSYFEGFNPLYPPHKVLFIKDINSKWLLDYGVQEFKQLTDLDGHNIDVKYAGGDRVNHSRVVITSNFTIQECIEGTQQDFMVGVATELQALYRRFKQIEIGDFLALAGLALCTEHIRPGTQVSNYMDLFVQYKENEIPGYGTECDPHYCTLRQAPRCFSEAQVVDSDGEDVSSG